MTDIPDNLGRNLIDDLEAYKENTASYGEHDFAVFLSGKDINSLFKSNEVRDIPLALLSDGMVFIRADYLEPGDMRVFEKGGINNLNNYHILKKAHARIQNLIKGNTMTPEKLNEYREEAIREAREALKKNNAFFNYVEDVVTMQAKGGRYGAFIYPRSYKGITDKSALYDDALLSVIRAVLSEKYPGFNFTIVEDFIEVKW